MQYCVICQTAIYLTILINSYCARNRCHHSVFSAGVRNIVLKDSGIVNIY